MPVEPDHELARAANLLLGEIKREAPEYAAQLFPGGPAGHQEPPKSVLHDMVATHWEEPAFRKQMLDRLAPPGPNGLPTMEEGIDEFLKLYTDAVLRTPTNHPETMTERGAQDSYEVPGYGPGQVRRMTKADEKDPTTASVPPPPPVAPGLPTPPGAAPGGVPLAPPPGGLPPLAAGSGAPPPPVDPSVLALLPAGITPPPGAVP